MACARCDFYLPKESSQGQLLATKDGLLKFLHEIPLSDEERAAVDGDIQALEHLLIKLDEVPTPSGRFPNRTSIPVIPLDDACTSRAAEDNTV